MSEPTIIQEKKGPARFHAALVGQGPALAALARLVRQGATVGFFPGIEILAWVHGPEGRPGTGDPALSGLQEQARGFQDIPELFAACPGLDLVVDLSPDARFIPTLREQAPPATVLVPARTVLRLCEGAGQSPAPGQCENLRRSQQLFALLVDQTDGDIFILDEDSVIVDVNRYAAQTRGLTREQIIGKRCRELDKHMPLCQGDDVECPYHEARRSGKKADHTFAQLTPSGRMRYIHTLCFPVVNVYGNSTLYLFIRRDVTEKQHLEQRLQRSEKMAAIGELSTFMAHEIRNPLFSIGGFANALLRDPSLSDLAREKARIIYDESRRLDVILTNILNFARPTEQTLSEFDAALVARQTLELMTIGSEERDIRVAVDIDPGLPRVRGNAENLKQCLINLIKNALEAMPEGGTLTLTAKPGDADVLIEVRDTGHGIPAELHEKIFSPFFTTKNSGSGLGLAMTRKVIGEMSGAVSLESAPGQGTRITVSLPVALEVEGES